MPRYSAAVPMLVAWFVACPATPAIAQDADEVPVAAFPDAEVVAADEKTSVTYPLITAAVASPGGTDANLSATRTLDGQLIRRTYRLPADADPRRAFAHYLSALKDADFEILYECDGASCGGKPFVTASPGHRAQPSLFETDDQRYLAARRVRDARDIYVAVQVAGADGNPAHVQVDVLEIRPHEVAAITVDAEEMARQLRDTGHVALYGIYFDTDSARLKPASEPTLREIARLMENRSDLRLLVVGHTDVRGDFDYNIDLSRRRAASVVQALVEDYDVDRSRLKPWGVGFTAPDDTNRTSHGRSRNRRVELVTW